MLIVVEPIKPAAVIVTVLLDELATATFAFAGVATTAPSEFVVTVVVAEFG